MVKSILHVIFVVLILFLTSYQAKPLVAAEDFPPGWVPVNHLTKEPNWSDFRKIDDRIHLYLPSKKPVRGVFACFVFHSGDPRELADLWNFALVMVPDHM